MKVYWIRAQAPRRVLALLEHLRVDAELSRSPIFSWRPWRPTGAKSEMPLGSFRNIVRWIDDLMRLPAWADPWPAGASTRP